MEPWGGYLSDVCQVCLTAGVLHSSNVIYAIEIVCPLLVDCVPYTCDVDARQSEQRLAALRRLCGCGAQIEQTYVERWSLCSGVLNS